jgi:hypothetical protein
MGATPMGRAATEMAEHIWYIQAAFSPTTARSYIPVRDPSLSRRDYLTSQSRLSHRAKTGQLVSPDELPEQYVHDRAGRQTKLDLPIWNSAFVHVRRDVADVLRRFDIGNTVLRPIKVTLYGDKGVDEDQLILLPCNVRPTIDPVNSEPVPPAQVKRAGLRTDKAVHPGVTALRSALEGPAIWTDPGVNYTIFVNEDLATALQAEPFAKALRLKKIRLSIGWNMEHIPYGGRKRR